MLHNLLSFHRSPTSQSHLLHTRTRKAFWIDPDIYENISHFAIIFILLRYACYVKGVFELQVFFAPPADSWPTLWLFQLIETVRRMSVRGLATQSYPKCLPTLPRHIMFFFFPSSGCRAFPFLEKEQKRDWKEVNPPNWKALEWRSMVAACVQV